MSAGANEKQSEVIQKVPMACADEARAVEFLEEMRWGGTPRCARCWSRDVYQMKAADGSRNKRYLWRCHACKKQYTVRIGTVFEESRLSLRHWCYAFWRACTSKKGVSALEIKRHTGISYKSALFMMHRIRFAMEPDLENQPKLSGTVEADETYVGGKPRYKGRSRRGRGTSKQAVAVLVERGGRARAYVVPNVTAKTLKTAIFDLVDPSARMMTDEFQSYIGLDKYFPSHEFVNHKAKEYVRGDVYTNTAEGFFALVKRGITGIFHNVSKKHLHRYLAEFTFRYNNRFKDDGERLTAAIKAAVGKRLMYKEPVADAG